MSTFRNELVVLQSKNSDNFKDELGGLMKMGKEYLSGAQYMSKKLDKYLEDVEIFKKYCRQACQNGRNYFLLKVRSHRDFRDPHYSKFDISKTELWPEIIKKVGELGKKVGLENVRVMAGKRKKTHLTKGYLYYVKVNFL